MIHFQVQQSHKVLPAHRDCVVRLTGEAKAEGERPPLELVYVLDKSVSMEGRKIENARAAALASLELARPGDLLSLVAFAEEATILARQVDGGNVEPLRRAVREMTLDYYTNIHDGLDKSRPLLDSRWSRFGISSPHHRTNRRCLLMSDGGANSGPHELSDFEALAGTFKSEGITVDTIGFGNDYEAEPLAKISSITGGDHRGVCDEAGSGVDKAFWESVYRGATTGARDAVVFMRLHPQASVERVFGFPDHRVIGNQLEIPIGDIDADPREFSLNLKVTDLPKTDHLVLAEGELDYQDVASGRRQQIPFTVVVRTSADARTVRASCNRDVLIKTQLIEGLSRVVEAGPGAAAEAATYCEFLHKQGLGNSELAAITRKLTKGGADSKLLLDLQSRRDRGRTRTGLSGGKL